MCEALRNAVFPYCENKTNWLEAREEWLLDGEDKCEWEDREYCVCGKQLINLYYILHKNSGVRLQIGSECIHQFEVIHLLCQRCAIYDVPTKTSKYCDNCRNERNMIDRIIRYGYYKNRSYEGAWEEDKGIIKWELNTGVYNFDPHYRKFLENRLVRNTDGFKDVEPKPITTKDMFENFFVDFGKYKGQKFKDVFSKDVSYCRWVSNLETCSQYEFKKYCKYMLTI